MSSLMIFFINYFKNTAAVPVFILFLFLNIAAQDVLSANESVVSIEITNAAVNNGIVYIIVFPNADDFRREQPSIVVHLASAGTVLNHVLTIPYGEYVIVAFQDANNNEQLDSNFLGIPRELFTITNYSGRGYPSRDFNRHKIEVNTPAMTLSLRLYKL